MAHKWLLLDSHSHALHSQHHGIPAAAAPPAPASNDVDDDDRDV